MVPTLRALDRCQLQLDNQLASCNATQVAYQQLLAQVQASLSGSDTQRCAPILEHYRDLQRAIKCTDESQLFAQMWEYATMRFQGVEGSWCDAQAPLLAALESASFPRNYMNAKFFVASLW